MSSSTLPLSLFLSPVVTGATDGIGKEYAVQVSVSLLPVCVAWCHP
jgi:hypothetical protein